MWSSERRLVLAFMGSAALAGCFRPMLREDSAARGLRNRIALPEVDGRFGYFLHQSLQDRLGKPVAPEFRLEISTKIETQGLAVAEDDAITRLALVATGRWLLWRAGEQEPVLEGSALAQSGYSATGSLFATRIARRDVEERLARDLGERIARSIFAQAGEVL